MLDAQAGTKSDEKRTDIREVGSVTKTTKVIELTQRVRRAMEGYAIVLRDERDLAKKKVKFAEVLKAFIDDARKVDPDFSTFSTEHGRVTLVEPVKDDIDVDALWRGLKERDLLVPEVREAFSRTVNKAKLARLIDELTLPREVVKRYWTESPGTAYVKVTPTKE